MPELAPLAGRTTVLLPKSGAPRVQDSSIGGPMLWPVDEPWPYCGQPGHWAWPNEKFPKGPTPVVPVVQLFARDVHQLQFPKGKDVLQLVWCALLHPQDPYVALPRLYWRNEAEVLGVGVLQDIPEPTDGEYDQDFVPRPPCTVSPTVVVEYPNWDLPEELRPRIAEIEEEFGVCYTELACALQNKVGGYPAWTQPPDWPSCDCGHRMEHLLSIIGEEPLDMDMGDAGGIYIFLCRRCPELPYAHRYDCH